MNFFRIPSFRRPSKRRHQIRLRLDNLEERAVPATASITTSWEIRDDRTGDGLTADDPLMADAAGVVTNRDTTYAHVIIHIPGEGVPS